MFSTGQITPNTGYILHNVKPDKYVSKIYGEHCNAAYVIIIIICSIQVLTFVNKPWGKLLASVPDALWMVSIFIAAPPYKYF